MVAQPLKQHLSRHLERAFTPRSAMAVGSAMDQLTLQLAHEEEAQPHHMPPALAALHRGKHRCTTPATLLGGEGGVNPACCRGGGVGPHPPFMSRWHQNCVGFGLVPD